MNKDAIAGRYIWVVGASAGIGAALCRALASEGAHLALTARNNDALSELHCSLDGDQHLVAPCDVTDMTAVEACFNELQQNWPRIDEVIYLAGVYTPANITQYDAHRAMQTINVNLQGALRVLAGIVPYFIAQRGGTITLFGSVAGYRGLPKAPDYCASKAAINVLAEALDIDLSSHNVRVRRVCPGFVKTRLTDQNEFEMPFCITPEQAAEYTVQGMKGNAFEIHYPKRFTYIMKLLRIMPYAWYRWLLERML